MKYIENNSIIFVNRVSGTDSDYTPIWGGETDNYYRLLDFAGKCFDLDHKWVDLKMQATVQALAYTYPFILNQN